MKLIYIYTEAYEEIIKNEEIDFKSRYKIKFNDNELIISKNEYYIENFYSNYKNINEVTAIIGKNTSGKSSILKLINKAWNNIVEDINSLEIKYLMLFEDEEGIKYYKNLNRDINIITSKEVVGLKISEIDSNIDTTFIYFSGIFDRNPGLIETSKFIDIGTNNMLRKSIDNTYDRKRQIWNSKNDVREEMESDQFGFVDEFKKQETLKLMNYYRKVNNSDWQKKILFNFPQKLHILFEHNYILSREFIDSIRYDSKTFEDVGKLLELTDKYITYHELMNRNDKEALKTKFSLLVYYELIEYLYRVEQIYVNEWIEELIEYDLKINSNIIIENIKSFYSKNKVYYSSMEEYENFKKIENGENLSNEVEVKIDINKKVEDFYKINKLQGVIEYINCLEKNNEDNIKKIYIELIEVIEELEERSDLYLFKKQLDDLNEILVFENCKSPYKEIFYSCDEEDEKFYLYKDEIINILNNIDGILESDISYNYDSDFNEKTNQEDKKANEDDKKSFCVNEDISEDIEIKNIVYKYIELIKKFNELVEKKESTVENCFDLKINWDDKGIIDFFKAFDEIKIYTFNVELESGIISSGQVTYFELQYRLYDLIQNFKLDKNIILLIDEGDIYMHPGIQIKFIKHTMSFLNKFFKDKNIQLIITSNSPFIISDIPNSKIVYIEKNENGLINIDRRAEVNSIRTLGTPINELLVNSFFMNDGTVGELAQDKITEIIKKLYSENQNVSFKDLEYLDTIINSIGDEIIRWNLKRKIEELMENDENMRIKLIEKYRKKIELLEGGIIE